MGGVSPDFLPTNSISIPLPSCASHPSYAALTSLRPVRDIQVKVLRGAERESEDDLLHEERVVRVEGRPKRGVERHPAPMKPALSLALLRHAAHVEQRSGHERHNER